MNHINTASYSFNNGSSRLDFFNGDISNRRGLLHLFSSRTVTGIYIHYMSGGEHKRLRIYEMHPFNTFHTNYATGLVVTWYEGDHDTEYLQWFSVTQHGPHFLITVDLDGMEMDKYMPKNRA